MYKYSAIFIVLVVAASADEDVNERDKRHVGPPPPFPPPRFPPFHDEFHDGPPRDFRLDRHREELNHKHKPHLPALSKEHHGVHHKPHHIHKEHHKKHHKPPHKVHKKEHHKKHHGKHHKAPHKPEAKVIYRGFRPAQGPKYNFRPPVPRKPEVKVIHRPFRPPVPRKPEVKVIYRPFRPAQGPRLPLKPPVPRRQEPYFVPRRDQHEPRYPTNPHFQGVPDFGQPAIVVYLKNLIANLQKLLFFINEKEHRQPEPEPKIVIKPIIIKVEPAFPPRPNQNGLPGTPQFQRKPEIGAPANAEFVGKLMGNLRRFLSFLNPQEPRKPELQFGSRDIPNPEVRRQPEPRFALGGYPNERQHFDHKNERPGFTVIRRDG